MPLFRGFGARKDASRGTTALEVRKGLEGLLSGPGVLPGAASPLVQGTAGFAYQLNAAHFVTRRATGDGVQLFGNDGPVTVATGVAPGSGLSRIDVIWVRHPSAGENGDTDSAPVLGVTQGTAASIPVAPSIPAGALEVARNTMTSAATSTGSAGNTIAQTAAPARLVSGEGWTSYTPSFTNFTLGNGSMAARWREDNGLVTVEVDIVLGSTSSLSPSPPYIALPPAALPGSAYDTLSVLGQVFCVNGANVWQGAATRSGSTARTHLSGGTAPSTSVPFTWGAGNRMSLRLSYSR